MSQGDKEQQENNDQAVPVASNAETENTEAEKAADFADQAESTSDSKTQPKPKKSNKAGLFLFVLVLILLAFGGGGYGAYYYLNQQMLERESTFTEEVRRVEDAFAAFGKANQDLNRKQADLQRALTAGVSGMENQMTALAERLSANESAGPADWTLAEVEYLLRIANQRLITSRDHQTAIEMLQAADNILVELAYPELASVRRQLAVDITELQLANQVDVEGVYFALDALSSEIADLDQFNPEQLEPIEIVPAEAGSKWTELWSKVVQILSRYVRIDTEVGEPEYLVSDEQEVVQRLAIQLQIRQAQLAVLSGQQPIYSSALKSAAESVRNYYKADNASLNLSQRLEELALQKVEQQPIDVNESIRILSGVVDQLSRTKGLSREQGQ